MMISKKKKEFEGEYTFTDRESEDKFPEFKQTKDPSFVNVEKVKIYSSACE